MKSSVKVLTSIAVAISIAGASAPVANATAGTPAPASFASHVAPAAAAGPDCIVCGVPKKTVRVVSGPVRVNNKHVKYLTGAWIYTNKYTWSQTTTASATVSSTLGVTSSWASSSLGLGASMSQSYGVSVDIPANRARQSKLTLRSDFQRRYVEVYYVSNGKRLSTTPGKFAYLYTPIRGEQFIAPAYR